MSTIIKSIGISNPQISKTRYHFQAAKVIENPDNNSGKKKTPKHPFSFEHRCARLPDFFSASRFPSPGCRKGITQRQREDSGEISIRRYRLANNANRPTGMRGRTPPHRVALYATDCVRGGLPRVALPEHCSPWSNGSSGRGKFDQRCDSIYPPPPSVSPCNSLFLFMRLSIKPRRDTRHLLSISMARRWRRKRRITPLLLERTRDPLTRFKLRVDRVGRIQVIRRSTSWMEEEFLSKIFRKSGEKGDCRYLGWM